MSRIIFVELCVFEIFSVLLIYRFFPWISKLLLNFRHDGPYLFPDDTVRDLFSAWDLVHSRDLQLQSISGRKEHLHEVLFSLQYAYENTILSEVEFTFWAIFHNKFKVVVKL